jgi:two-component system, chemotaxis family, protein-glutamate methylesterase/glutaminase
LDSQEARRRELPLPSRVVCLAASAGGLAALSRVLSELPAGFGACIVVLQHLDPRYRSMLPEILRQRVALAVEQVHGGERLAPGTIYVAPPDRHVLVGPGAVLALDDGVRINFSRPSADVLFASLAESVGKRAVAVVLSGSGHDGARGIIAVKRHGGTVIVQDEATSEFFGMPCAAQETGVADRVLPLEAIAEALIELTASEAMT